MTLKMQTPAWNPVPRIELVPCNGSLSSEGWRRDCYDDCAAHFDAWATGETEYGDRSEAYSPYPNALIASVGLIPATAMVDRWEEVQVYGDSRVVQSVVLVWTPGLLGDEDGRSIDAWVVLRNDDFSDVFSAHLTLDEGAARSLFAAAVAELDDDYEE